MKFRILELYSGIGGTHFAFEESGLDFVVVGAVDVNNFANEVYKHNFPDTPLFQRNIESLTVRDLELLSPNTIWMSPPCQPFTRNGLKKDCSDYRTSSFLHILDLLKQMVEKPLFILLENVKGFDESAAHRALLETLSECGYNFQEYLLSPNQIGVPNSRLRYYLLAKLKPLRFSCFSADKSITNDFPLLLSPTANSEQPNEIEDYLCQEFPHFVEFLLSDKVLAKYFYLLDIIEPHHRRSCCFTKGYSHYAEGTGSILKTNDSVELATICSLIEQEQNEDEKLLLLRSLKLRYFTPREVANLMGFPPRFRFPEQFTTKQKYKLLGNSLSVNVVSYLLKYINQDL